MRTSSSNRAKKLHDRKYLNFKGLFVGHLAHTGYPNLHPGVLRMTVSNGKKDGDPKTQME